MLSLRKELKTSTTTLSGAQRDRDEVNEAQRMFLKVLVCWRRKKACTKLFKEQYEPKPSARSTQHPMMAIMKWHLWQNDQMIIRVVTTLQCKEGWMVIKWLHCKVGVTIVTLVIKRLHCKEGWIVIKELHCKEGKPANDEGDDYNCHRSCRLHQGWSLLQNYHNYCKTDDNGSLLSPKWMNFRKFLLGNYVASFSGNSWPKYPLLLHKYIHHIFWCICL